MNAAEGGKTYHVVFMCQLTLLDGQPLIHDANYPNIAKDYQRTFTVLGNMPCDVFLGEHGYMFDLKEKLARLADHPRTNPFVDPAGCRHFIAKSQSEFEAALKKEAGAS